MSTSQDDRRVRKTKKALREGLAELISKKDIHNITIKELTDKADIHRSTFYAHYEDLYALYQELEDSVIEELDDIITENFSLHFNEYYEVLFRYIGENKQLCKMLFSNNNALHFSHRLAMLFKGACLKNWCSILNLDHVSEELDYYAQYHLQGCFAMISKWVSSDFEYSSEKIIKMMADIDANIELYLKKATSPSRLEKT
ncbi:MAG: TetR-like C-terminal domain-containing protein [Muricomes sp.]